MVGAVLLTGAAVPAEIRVDEQRVSVPGGPGAAGPVELDTTFYAPSTTPAPAVLVAHGFGGSKASVDADARELAARGFAVLAVSARAPGRSPSTRPTTRWPMRAPSSTGSPPGPRCCRTAPATHASASPAGPTAGGGGLPPPPSPTP